MHGGSPVIDMDQPGTSKDTVYSRKVAETHDEALKAASDLLESHALKQSEKYSDEEDEWVIDETPDNNPPVVNIPPVVCAQIIEKDTDNGKESITETDTPVDTQVHLGKTHEKSPVDILPQSEPGQQEEIIPVDAQIQTDLFGDDASADSLTASQIEKIIEAETQKCHQMSKKDTLVSASITLSSDSDSDDKIIFPDDPSNEPAEAIERAMAQNIDPVEEETEEKSPKERTSDDATTGHYPSIITTHHARGNRKRNGMANLRENFSL